MATPIPFGRVLREGNRGVDVKAVKRALARAGYGATNLSRITTLFGPYATRNLKAFQRKKGLSADGVYGPQTHAKLTPSFDALARKMYTGYEKILQLPATFTPTHQTNGLVGYPAIDVFAPGGTPVGCPCDGKVRKHSGHPPTLSATPGGPYGWSIYVSSSTTKADFFLTHFGQRFTTVGQIVHKGDVIGTVADYAKATNGVTASHIHEGKKR